MAENLRERVIKVVCEHIKVTESEVTEKSAFMEDLGADSLDVVELVMGVEEEFGIDIPDDDVSKLVTVGDLIEYIQAKS